jgi:hypothetical protein
MKSLFNQNDNAEMIARINQLTQDAPRQWGTMNAAQMIAHIQRPLKVAFGELKLKKSLVGILLEAIAKKQLAGEKPFKKNLPIDKIFKVSGRAPF